MGKKIPEYRLQATPITEEARTAQGFRWAEDGIGRRHRLGGVPDFLQGPKWPHCPSCKDEMSFYAQLDSIGDTVCIADCGMIYVFICLDCNETTSFIQSN